MSASDRFHRDKPTRIEPVRNFSGLYKWSESDTSSNGFTGSTTSNNVVSDGQENSRDEGVGLAYRVIEKHINDGKKNAGLFNGQPYNIRPITDGFQELLEKTLRYQSELLPLWLEALSSAVRFEPGRVTYPGASAGRSESKDAQTNGTKAISIEMSSTRPVQVSIDLRENSEMLPLITLGLRAVDEHKPPLNDITFVPDGTRGAIKLKISIPDNHPPDTYSGVIVNRSTGEMLGTLSVRIAQ
jgi:hypothetical protein